MKYAIVKKKQFQKSLNKLIERGLSKQALDDLNFAIQQLASGQTLPAKFCDHALKGQSHKTNYRDCHIQGDLVLVYQIKKAQLILELVNLGSHNQVFNETLRDDVSKEIEDAMSEPVEEFDNLDDLFRYLGLRGNHNKLIESFETHKELNPKLFENNSLKQDVRKALLAVVVTFVKDLEENEVPLHVVDVWLIGSNASFNYTNKSDIDLHIITNSSELSCDPALLKVVYNYAKSAFNRNHDITIKDLPVEVYIQDCESTVNSNGIYSVIDDCWIKQPKPITITYPDLKHLAQLKQLVATYKALDRNDLDAVSDLIDLAYKIRKEGQLEGEFSDGNLSFKEFRNLGYLDDLKELKLELESKELTLEKLQ